MKTVSDGQRSSSVISVLEEKCVNCQACIQACPVKFCNDGSGETIGLTQHLCIGCGSCLSACKHEARKFVDDFDEAMQSLARKQPAVAIVAPSLAANFPEQYLLFNGWLKSIGIDAVFDVSFGAELTVKSYIDYLKTVNPPTLIASPCPAIVDYIQLYRPSLRQYLAPIDSPMVHTIKMIRRYYPKYTSHNIVVVSPCLLKRREFQQVGLSGVYNVTYRSIEEYLSSQEIRLDDFEKIDFANDPAERAVLFSSPGGFLRTISRDMPGIAGRIRKIEDPSHVYPYLDRLQDLIDQGIQPRIIDCLNCEKGCNGGPGTNSQAKNIDELEFHIEQRHRNMRKRYQKQGILANSRTRQGLNRVLEKYWERDLYSREFEDCSSLTRTRMPNCAQLAELYTSMKKIGERDFLNCNACGYITCEGMAVAIFNWLNKVENCHHFMKVSLEEEHRELEEQSELLQKFAEELEVSHVEVRQSNKELQSTNNKLEEKHQHNLWLNNELESSLELLETEHEELLRKTRSIEKYAQELRESQQKTEETNRRMHAAQQEKLRLARLLLSELHELNRNNTEIAKMAGVLSDMSSTQEQDIKMLMTDISSISSVMMGLNDIVDAISSIAGNIDLLALNASIVAAQAGTSGHAFAVVAQEVKQLAKDSRQEVKKIIPLAETVDKKISATNSSASMLFEHFRKSEKLIEKVRHATKSIATSMGGLVGEAQELVGQEDSEESLQSTGVSNLDLTWQYRCDENVRSSVDVDC